MTKLEIGGWLLCGLFLGYIIQKSVELFDKFLLDAIILAWTTLFSIYY